MAEKIRILDLEFAFTGEVEEGSGWLGYMKTMLLSKDRVAKKGSKPEYTNECAVRLAVKAV